MAIFAAVFVVSLFLHHNLIDRLSQDTYTNLFSLLIYIRLILFFCLGFWCLIWYSRRLNQLAGEIIKGNRIL
jgi:hypothetical protein